MASNVKVGSSFSDVPIRIDPQRFGPVFRGLEALHSGLISDHVAWIAVGFAAVVVAFGLA